MEKLNPSFQWLNLTQFLGAMNDNVFKLLVVFFLIRNLGSEHADRISSIGGIIFALPFLFFTPMAGILADRFSKSRLTFWTRVAEIGVMATACLVFAMDWYLGAFLLLFLMSTQSAFFGPSKYGVIPELVHSYQLSRANSYLVAMTYMAIIAGSVAGPLITELMVGPALTDHAGILFAQAGLFCIVLALAGTFASSRIERTAAAGSHGRPSLLVVRDVIHTFRSIREDRFLVLATIAAAYFSLIGAFIQINLIPYAIDRLGLADTDGGYLFIYAAVGIGAGSLMAGRLSGRNIEFGAIPIGALLMAAAMLALHVLPPGVLMTGSMMLVAGIGAGIYLIPIEAFIQYRAPDDRRGKVLAASSFLSWLGVLGAGILIFVLSYVPGWRPEHTFLLLGLLTLGLTVATVIVLPDFLVRFVVMLITRVIYRIRTTGLENIPEEGGALLVSNHVSYMDAVQILACQQRRIRFLMERRIFDTHPLRFLFPLMGVIPISVHDSPKKILASLQAAREELDKGYLVCVFAEGALTRTGQMRDFKPGMERIVKGTRHPVIPVYLGGTWGSIFSNYYADRPDQKKIRLRYPMSISFGPALPPETSAWRVRLAVMELSTLHAGLMRDRKQLLGRLWVSSARRFRKRICMTDTTGREMTFGKALVASIILSRRIAGLFSRNEAVGILLPPSAGGALANMAVTMAGNVSVNLNVTAPADFLESAIHQAKIEGIITSRAFMERFPDLRLSGRLEYLEDLVGSAGMGAKLSALLSSRFLPVGLLCRTRGQNADDPATILFSSGTTGVPKGIVLSHHNIISNLDSMARVLRPSMSIQLCAMLPLFHSFGLTCGVYFPLLTGIAVHYHTNPLEADRVIAMIRERKCTVMFSAPSFLLQYLRRAQPEDFKSLKWVVTGAEKLNPRVAAAFEEKFGIMPLEGYGATELSPVVSFGLPDMESDGIFQVGHREGSVGQALPGIAARVVDPDSGELLPPGERGQLEVKGPNLMTGYLGRDDLTRERIREGWYQTGDLAEMDEEGFIFISDRLLRFSKVGGEMVPHAAVEDVIHKALRSSEPMVAVTSVHHPTKGERLVLVYSDAAGTRESLQQVLKELPLPNLWKPSPADLCRVDVLPMTPSGKLDLGVLRKLAQDCCGQG